MRGLILIVILVIIIAAYLNQDIVLNKLYSKNITLMDAIIVGIIVVIISSASKIYKFIKGLIKEN